MKKTTRNILVMLLILLVVGGGATFLLLTPPSEEENSSSDTSSVSEASAPETVMAREDETVKSITVENEAGTYNLVPYKDETGTIAYAVEGLEDYNIDTAISSAAARSILELSAVKTLEPQDDLAQFGLAEKGNSTITVSYNNGTEPNTLILGDTAAETYGNYVLKDSDDKIYICQNIDTKLLGTKFDYFSKSIYMIENLPAETEGGEVPADILKNVTIKSTAAGDKPIEIKYDTSNISPYLMTSPVKTLSVSERFDNVMLNLEILTADSIVAVKYTDKDLEEYGLKEPDAEVDFTLNNETHSIKVSEKTAENQRYAIVDDTDIIYLLRNDAVSAWAEATVMDLRTPYLWLPNIIDVKKLTVTNDKDSVVFNVTRTKNEETSTEENPIYDLTVENADKLSIDYDNYQKLYMALISLPVLNSTEVPYDKAEPVLSHRFDYINGESDEFVFYKIKDADRYAVEFNGEFCAVVRKSSIDEFIPKIDLTNSNTAIS